MIVVILGVLELINLHYTFQNDAKYLYRALVACDTCSAMTRSGTVLFVLPARSDVCGIRKVAPLT